MIHISMLIAAGTIVFATVAEAGSCSKEIEMVTKLIGGGGAAGGGLVTADTILDPAGTGSTLGAVRGNATANHAPLNQRPADINDVAEFNTAAGNQEALQNVQLAQKANTAGDETSCMEYIGKAKDLLGLVQ